MIGIQDIDLKQTRFYQDVFSEGRREGRQEGRQEGELLVLKRLLERKFGRLNATLQGRLAQADAETLLLWSERLLDARTLDDVFSAPSKPA